MKISELQAILETTKQTIGDVEVAYHRYSDYTAMHADEIEVIEAIPNLNNVGWITRVHPRMDPADLAQKQSYLLFPGN